MKKTLNGVKINQDYANKVDVLFKLKKIELVAIITTLWSEVETLKSSPKN